MRAAGSAIRRTQVIVGARVWAQEQCTELGTFAEVSYGEFVG